MFADEGDSWKAQRTHANPFFKQSTIRSLFDNVVRWVVANVEGLFAFALCCRRLRVGCDSLWGDCCF
jgi:hypothetical protein